MLNNFRTCLIVPIRDSLPCPQVYVLVYHLKPLQQRWLNSINLVNVINSNNKHTIILDLECEYSLDLSEVP